MILIPKIPYSVEKVASAILQRHSYGRQFSIVAVSEGALSRETAQALRALEPRTARGRDKEEKKNARKELAALEELRLLNTQNLTQQLEQQTGLESRVTILGHVQRGGTPSPADCLLATRLGTACAQLINDGLFGVMVAARGDGVKPVPLKQVVDKRKNVPPDHPWVRSVRDLGVSLGD